MLKGALIIFVLFVTSACWRMPEEGEVSTLPNVNNPAYTHKTSAEMMPSPEIGY